MGCCNKVSKSELNKYYTKTEMNQILARFVETQSYDGELNIDGDATTDEDFIVGAADTWVTVPFTYANIENKFNSYALSDLVVDGGQGLGTIAFTASNSNIISDVKFFIALALDATKAAKNIFRVIAYDKSKYASPPDFDLINVALDGIELLGEESREIPDAQGGRAALQVSSLNFYPIIRKDGKEIDRRDNFVIALQIKSTRDDTLLFSLSKVQMHVNINREIALLM